MKDTGNIAVKAFDILCCFTFIYYILLNIENLISSFVVIYNMLSNPSELLCLTKKYGTVLLLS